MERRRLRVTGVVQGVGFRPFVHRLAGELGLGGFVGNDATGVFVEVEGEPATLDRFAERLVGEAPRLAVVASVHAEAVPTLGDTQFRIVASAARTGDRTAVPPDVAVCDACLAEVRDPADRRHRYPFTNCTDCGPRFTIIRDLPYDRPLTTMAGFPMCAACRAEYEDPDDRRYHAQPVACPACGPQLAYVGRTGVDSTGSTTRGTDASLTALHREIARGGVVAVKGIGGYHLACDARDDDAITELRRRKGRVDKPFAVMVPNLEAARALALIDDVEAEALGSPAHPIVLVHRHPDADLSDLVAPGNPMVGLMLPYTPLHHLLFAPVPGAATTVPTALVLTSGNVSDEPICADDTEARMRLADLADAFLVHDRPIHVPCDDSVVRVIDGEVHPVRRSRGFTPLPVTLPVEVAPIVAVGGELKNTFCVASGHRAWVSQHVGDMENLETLDAFARGVDGFRRMYQIEPEVWAVDGHPGYLTRRWAMRTAPAESVVEVQHHHAHVAAVMAEHGLDGREPVVGIAFDGTGYGVGADGRPEIWGGEVLLADYGGFHRLGHLRPLPLPGGDAAIANPCRIAVAYLFALGIDADPALAAVAACDPVELGVVRHQVERGLHCTPTTSMGRLFDAVASLAGVRHRISYEAQAAMELEALALRGRADPERPRWSFAVGDDGVIDPEPVLRGAVSMVLAGDDPADLAAELHHAIARAVADSARRALTLAGPRPVALTGGVFQNALLTRLTVAALRRDGHEVLTHRLVPANDGGLSLGQAVIAGVARHADRHELGPTGSQRRR